MFVTDTMRSLTDGRLTRKRRFVPLRCEAVNCLNSASCEHGTCTEHCFDPKQCGTKRPRISLSLASVPKPELKSDALGASATLHSIENAEMDPAVDLSCGPADVFLLFVKSSPEFHVLAFASDVASGADSLLLLKDASLVRVC